LKSLASCSTTSLLAPAIACHHWISVNADAPEGNPAGSVSPISAGTNLILVRSPCSITNDARGSPRHDTCHCHVTMRFHAPYGDGMEGQPARSGKNLGEPGLDHGFRLDQSRSDRQCGSP